MSLFILIQLLTTNLFSMMIPSFDSNALEVPRAKFFKVTEYDSELLNTTSFFISWDRLYTVYETDPVEGYKVYLWRVPKVDQATVRINDLGDPVYTVVESYNNISIEDFKPEGSPIIMNATAYRTHVKFTVPKGVMYQLAIKAFTKKRESALSDPIRIPKNTTKP